MKLEILTLSEKQREKIREYIVLTGDNTFPETNEPLEKYPEQALRYLNILEAFENDPKKAAAYWNNALAKARQAMDDVYAQMLSHIPKPTKEHFYSCFGTVEEAEIYKERVNAEAGKAYDEMLDIEFFDRYVVYRIKQIETPKTLQ
ncbi:MAG: hypothetical protein K9G62_04740 [Alphaproteobacteria bacterium]|nr:hypothetical protein [Alphaproteobacteria bacterium]